MATTKTTKKGSKERASTSRERKLALALRAILDVTDELVGHHEIGEPLAQAANDAHAVLKDLGYNGLVGIPKRVAALNALLTDAVTAGDGKEISRLGLELERAKLGKPPLKPAPSVASKSSRKSTVTKSTANTAAETGAAGVAAGGNSGE